MSQSENETTQTESYILRIYRRKNNHQKNLVGTVTDTSLGQQASFKSTQELINWLTDIKICGDDIDNNCSAGVDEDCP